MVESLGTVTPWDMSMNETNPSNPVKDHRRIKRRATKKGTSVICRKGKLGLGPNLAIRIRDISEEGTRLLLKSQLAKGDDIEITLTAPGTSRPLTVMAVVAWSVPAKEGDGFWTGAKFRNPLNYSDMFHFI
jgi:hypothetical protein